MKKYIFYTGLFLIFAPTLFASATAKKGDWFFFWGWNRTAYSNSDIQFTGNGYDFTVYDVAASDRPSPISFSKYILEPSLPQTNFQLGYFIDEHQSISLAVDHMKYVVNTNQTVNASGTTSTGAITSLTTGADLAYEHTDGLNYINATYEYNQPVWIAPSKRHAVVLLAGVGVGFVMPKSNVTLGIENKSRYDEFHIAGMGADIHAGFDVNFLDDFFLRNVFKAGYIYLPDVRTSPDSSDKGSQSFYFAQWMFTLGYRF